MRFDDLIIPASILETTQRVIATAKSVRIDTDALAVTAQKVDERLCRGIDDIQTAFGSSGSLERDVNMVFFETAVNFYFWAEDDASKWKVKKDDKWIGGWCGLAACFANANSHGVPVYDTDWMARLTIETARELFFGNGQQIPLLEQRVNNLVEVANWLLQNYDGQALAMVESCEFSAPRIAKKVIQNLPSFRDGAWYGGE